MTTIPQGEPEPVPETIPTEAKKPGRGWLRWAVPVGAGVLGLIIGIAAGGGGGDPTQSDEYVALQGQYDELNAQLDTVTQQRDEARSKISEAEQSASKALQDVADREVAVAEKENEADAREAKLDAREAAVGALEQQVAATQIRNGLWTVGVDIEPGKYRVAEEVTSSCYWAILKSGTNGSDIIENDIVTGGFPQVTLSGGQDFKNDCGVWNKVG